MHIFYIKTAFLVNPNLYHLPFPSYSLGKYSDFEAGRFVQFLVSFAPLRAKGYLRLQVKFKPGWPDN